MTATPLPVATTGSGRHIGRVAAHNLNTTDNTMQQHYLDIPDLRRTDDRGHAHRIATGAVIAAACGLQCCYTTTWDNGQCDRQRISLTVYRPLYGSVDHYAVTRFFGGQYASVDCLIPGHATRAILAATREEFERVVAASAARRVRVQDDVVRDDADAMVATLLWSDVGAARERDRQPRTEGAQMSLFPDLPTAR